MRKVTQALSLFYSTTEDSSADARKELVERVVRRAGHSRDVVIRVVHWRDNIPGGTAPRSGQTRINAEVRGAYDIYFGCMGTKFGEGTVAEFENAIHDHISKGDPTEVLFAFDAKPVNPFSIPEEFRLVKEFRDSLQNDKKYGRAILYFEFGSDQEFEDLLSRDLDEAIRKAIGRISGGPPPFR